MKRSRRIRWIWWVLFTCVLLMPGCDGCSCSRQTLAELTETQGSVSRDYAKAVNDWKPADVGAEFSMGDAVRTEKQSRAVVVFDDGATLVMEPVTTLRFMETEPGSGERGLQVEQGTVTVTAATAELLLRTDVGVARIEPGAAVLMQKGKKGLRFFVKVGRARLESGDKLLELQAGQGVEVGVGLAVLNRFGKEAFEEHPDAGAPADAEPAAEKAVIKGDIIAIVAGPGTSAQAPGQDTWTPLPAGDTKVTPGTKLKLTAKASTKVRRGGQEAALSGPGEYVVTGNADNFVAFLGGSSLLTADGADVTMKVPGGTVTANGSMTKSVAEVKVSLKKLVTVDARLGSITVKIGERSETLRGGQSVTVNEKGEFQVQGRGIGFADITIKAGGSLAIHDPDPPTAVGITFGGMCPGDGVVQLGKGVSAVGKGGANLRVHKGRHPYQLRCIGESGVLDEAVAKGAIVIMHDAGTAPLAAGAPATFVDTDGRTYTVMYQNRLPSVSVRWPHPPPADSYTLVHTSPGGTKSYSTASPNYSFRSGSFVEGTHKLVFKTGAKSSRSTTLLVKFDATAPKASIRSPENGSFGPGATVNVSGQALPGFRVTAGGTDLPLDAQHRFSGSATAGPRVLLIRFSHARRGGGTYLRRASGVPR